MMDEEFASLAEHLLSRELYDKWTPTYDEGCSPETEVPFNLLSGENPTYLSLYNKGDHLIVLTNYRLFATTEEGYYSVALGLIEGAEVCYPRDLILLCKDVKRFRLSLDSGVQCKIWSERIQQSIKPKINFRDNFAFVYFAYKPDSQTKTTTTLHPLAVTSDLYSNNTSIGTGLLTTEYKRMGMDISGMWRITECNTKYKICSSYPKLLVVPRSMTDNDLQEVTKFRALGRVPAVVWRHRGNGCVLARCSQPMLGLLGWRCQEDEKLLMALSQACISQTHSRAPPVEIMQRGGERLPLANGHTFTPPSLLILDLRSYAAALGNRAKGGGCEHPDYYSNCEIKYKGLANIHSIRKSFQSLRTLLSGGDQTSYFSSLENSQWMFYISQLLSTAIEVASSINLDNRPVLVHCSDGWDRTTQVVALSQILLDPFYRTIKGFQILVEREWLSFGHKFADRCGQGIEGEQSPIFLQWLDCIYQLLKQFPTAFEFNINYLIKLIQHGYSQLYGTFLANCEQEREEDRVPKQTLSVWTLLNDKNKLFVNVLYKKDVDQVSVLYPSCQLKHLQLAQELYGTSHLIPYSSTSPTLHTPPSSSHLTTPSNTPPIDDVIHHHISNGTLPQLSNDDVTINSNDSIQNGITPVTNEDHSTHNGDTTINYPDNEISSDCSNEQGHSLSKSDVFHSLNGSTISTDKSHLLWHSAVSTKMEESFRIVEEISEPSLTVRMVSNTKLEEDDDPPITPTVLSPRNGVDNDRWSSSSPCKMNMSMFSECESRLRNLTEDGMSQYSDPVQERVKEIEENYQHKISHLEEKLRRMTQALRHKLDSSEGREEENKEISKLVDELSEITEQPSSPANGWTYVDMSDTHGVHWIPDHAVTHCRLCGTEFWMGRRKHHCRNCGGVFCWKCSDYYCPVPHEQLFENQRVCRNCFDKLDGFLKQTQNKESTVKKN